LAIQSPTGLQFTWFENRCFGCINGSLSFVFSLTATQSLPEHLCTSGEYLPTSSSLWTTAILNQASSFGHWTLLASSRSNVSVQILSASIVHAFAQLSVSIIATTCTAIVWYSDSACGVQIPVGSGTLRKVSSVVSAQRDQSLVSSTYYNYSLPKNSSATSPAA